MRVFVHVGDDRLLTTIARDRSVADLRLKIEREHASLHPCEIPLRTHALRDGDGYLLADALVVGEVLSPNDSVDVVRSSKRLPELPMECRHVVGQWHAWQRFAAHSLAAESAQGLLACASSSVLFQLCGSFDISIARQAAETLNRLAAVGPGGVGAIVQNPGFTRFCALCRSSSDAATQRACADTLAALVEAGQLLRGNDGGAEALMHMASSAVDDAARDVATRTLALLHKTRAKQKERTGDGADPPFLESISTTTVNVGVRDFSRLVDALSTLATCKDPEAQRFAAETLAAEATAESFVDFVESTGGKVVRVLAKVSLATHADSKLRHAVAQMLLGLASTERGVASLHRLDGIVFSGELVSHEGPASDVALETLRSLCLHPTVRPHAADLVELLRRASGDAVRRVAAKGLRLVAEVDGANVLGRHIRAIVPLAASATGDSDSQADLVATLGRLSLKEVNKSQIVHYGGSALFASLLQPDSPIEVQRTAAKALANLSSSDRKTRAAVVREVELSVPAVHQFHDSVVHLYLEMLFTP